MLGETIRNVVIIVLLAAFIEMLLPGEEMGRYVRLVMGLFVIIALLQPMVGMLGDGQTFEVSAYSSVPVGSNMELDNILNRGKAVERQARQVALQEYRQRLARQIQAMVQLVPGVKQAEVEVEVEEEAVGSLGSIKRVAVVVEIGDGSPETPDAGGTVTRVEPVKIEVTQDNPLSGGTNPETPGGREEGGPEIEGIKREVVAVVSNFYSIRPEQVQVIVATE